MMKKYSKRLFSGLMVTLLLGGNLISSVGAYAETVLEEPKNGETTSGESSTPPNGEKETSLPSLQDNLPKPADPSVPEQPKVESPTEAPKVEEPKVDSKTEAEKNDEREETGKLLELPELSNLVTPTPGSMNSGYWGSSPWKLELGTLYIGTGDFNEPVSSINKTFLNGKNWEKEGFWHDIMNTATVRTIVIDGPVVLPTNSHRFFADFINLVEIVYADHLITDRVKNADEMFRNPMLERVDLSRFNTAGFESMTAMFLGTVNLQDIGPAHFDTTSATSIDSMFARSGLSKLNLTDFKGTPDMLNAFFEMPNLKEITIGPNTKIVPGSGLDPSTRAFDNYWFLNSDTQKIKYSEASLINDINSGAFLGTATLTLIRDSDIPRIQVHDSTIHEREAINLVETIDQVNPTGSGPLITSQSTEPTLKQRVDAGEITIDSTGFDPNTPGTYTINYSYRYFEVYSARYTTSSASATITVLPAQEVSLRLISAFEDHEMESITITGKVGIPFDLYKETKINPYLYCIREVDGEGSVSYEDDPGGKTGHLVYTPSLDDTDIVIITKNNQPITIETNSLTYNLGQSNPGNLEATIKNMIAYRYDGIVGSMSFAAYDPATKKELTYPSKYDQTLAIDLKADPTIKFDVAVDPAVLKTIVSKQGTKTLPLEVTIHSSDFSDFKQTVNVSVRVIQGMSIELKGSGAGTPYRDHIAMKLNLNWGESTDTFDVNTVLDDGTPGRAINSGVMGTYFSVGFLSGAEGLSLSKTPDWNVDVRGTDTNVAGISAVGDHTFNKSDTNIIKVFHAEAISIPDRLRLWDGSKLFNVKTIKSPALINNTTFFEMTAEGYKLLTLNQLTPKNEQSIFKNASHDYLNAHVKEFIDSDKYPGLTVSWSEYPDTSTEGDKQGKLLVTQKSSTNKDLTYEYPVSVNVVPGSVQLSVSDIAHFDDITIDGKAKVIQSSDFTAKIIDTASVSEPLHGRHYSITASIANKNESLAPYLSYVTQYEIEKPGNYPDFEDIETEEERNNLLVKTVPKIIDTLNFHGFFSNDNPDEPIELNLWTFTPHSYPLFDEDSTTKEMNGLFLAIPANAPLKQGTYSATISWDIAEVPE